MMWVAVILLCLLCGFLVFALHSRQRAFERRYDAQETRWQGVVTAESEGWERRERDWTARNDRLNERVERLLDRLQQKAGAGMRVEHEQVVKIPDPEAMQPRTWLDDALKADQIKELVELEAPDAYGLSIMEIKTQYPTLWNQKADEWEVLNAPLRV